MKSSCDAATSPSRLSQKSPQPNIRWVNSRLAASSDLKITESKKIPSPSPRRLVATRNAATSPNLDVRKLSSKQCEIFTKDSDVSLKTVLEKSNSLGENKPNRQLRTTRSLSPRPPVRHQHAIMVSDENDMVSVKVSPNEDFDIDVEEKRAIEYIASSNMLGSGTIKKHKAQSEQTSPNLSDFDATFSYDKTNNRSTGCLVYVPSDPWLKMSDVGEKDKKSLEEYSKKKSKFTYEARSLSKGNLPIDNQDPWIWRKLNIECNLSPKSVKKSPKQEKYRKAKSFTLTKFEISDSMSKITTTNENGAKTPTNRPKLQRSKSPLIIDDEFLSTSCTKNSRKSCTCKDSIQNLSSTSPRKDFNSNTDTSTNLIAQQNKAFLHVVNPNLMQSRHSFSSISQKDDELQLNIRRLSEQIKNAGQASGADFTDYLNQFKYSEAKKSKTINSTKTDSDPVLETTC